MESLELHQDGLSWVQELFGLEPRWTIEPEVEAIKQTVQLFRPSSIVEVEFLAQGAFNKLYNVSIDGELFIMLVSLHVDPYYKITSEVATMDWARHITRLPIPRIVTYQSSRDNAIGFEWILMTKMPGRPFSEICSSIPFDMKSRLVRELARNSACLFRNQLRGIGNIYGVIPSKPAEESPPCGKLVDTESSIPAKAQALDNVSNIPGNGSSEAALPDVGRIVSMEFFWGSRIHQNIYRGPFPSSKDWITARLMLGQSDCDSTVDKHSAGDLDRDDENEIEDATRTLQIIRKLQSILPLIFPTNSDDLEPSIIFHNDLSRHNILVNDNGELTGVLDWECVSALPLWKACDYPSFLEGPPRRLEPDIGRYHHEANGEPCDLYFEHLWDHEATLLRDTYIEEMKRLDAGWMEVFDKSETKRDFDIAVQRCDAEFAARHINAWIGDITAGISNRSLRSRIDGT